VTVALGRATYRSTVAARGGRFLLPVSAAQREAAGVAAGDSVEVTLEVDPAPREVDVPPALAAALTEDPAARVAFEALSYSKRKEMARSVREAKQDATRERRLAAALASLRS
jgi:uncharacterized protein YdeI (YjbR/CyaY-like superfamily)